MKKIIFTLFLIVPFLVVYAQDTIHVPADYSTIQAGINAANNGDLVLVEDGTYIENINYRGKAITVTSNYIIDGDTNHISNTIIDGSQPSNSDSASVVTFNSGEDTTSVICGFTITGGTGTIIPEDPISGSPDQWIGGGIYIGLNSGASILQNHIEMNSILRNTYMSGGGIYSGDPGDDSYSIIEENIIRDNLVSGGLSNFLIGGGGIFMGGSGRIMNNEIYNNICESILSGVPTVGGGIRLWNLDVNQDTTHCVIKDNLIYNNKSKSLNAKAYAGGINSIGCRITMIGNTISYNTVEGNVENIGAGMHIGGLNYGENRIENNRFTGNHSLGNATSYGGALFIQNSNPYIYNNVFNNNEADYGGGLNLNNNSQPQVINNTIVSNIATNAGGGISSFQSTLTVMNSIIWDNLAPSNPQIFMSGGTHNITYSDIEGGWPGTGNINLNPELMDTVLTSGDTLFAILSINSPCIDTGNPGTFYNDFQDPSNPGYALFPSRGTIRNDMGAYGGPRARGWIKIVTDVDDGSQFTNEIPIGYQLNQNYPNPFNPSTKIKYIIPASLNPSQGGTLVQLIVYDILGRAVTELVNEEKQPGVYESVFDGSNLPSGVYLYRLTTSEFSETKKLVLLK